MPTGLTGCQKQKEPSIQDEATAGKENILFEEVHFGRIWRKMPVLEVYRQCFRTFKSNLSNAKYIC